MNRTLSTTNITTLNETGYNDMMESFNGTTVVDVKGFIDSLFYGVFGSMLNIGYLLVIGGIFYLMWNDQKSLLLPSILVLLFGRFLFTFIPDTMIMYAKVFAILGLVAVLVKLYRDGRQ
ncbi:MAG: hypothetical protein WC415_06065 [Patescibacteria group bacterium]|jgi:hypothetical protein